MLDIIKQLRQKSLAGKPNLLVCSPTVLSHITRKDIHQNSDRGPTQTQQACCQMVFVARPRLPGHTVCPQNRPARRRSIGDEYCNVPLSSEPLSVLSPISALIQMSLSNEEIRHSAVILYLAQCHPVRAEIFPNTSLQIRVLEVTLADSSTIIGWLWC